ncbi:MAG: glycosyltransferase family 4 protein [Parvibaculum sp.]|uniref:glycosyltransferase family 4 protein n=1 Tax=Parvibaculum sp. TaxID=2024848 RepID=UPI003C76D4CB
MSIAFRDLSPRPTILQVIPALDTGGAERTTIDMAHAIVAAGGRALVASSGGRMLKELEAAGATHFEMDVHSKNPIVMALNVERLTRLAEREKVDLIHARSRAPGWSALAAARRLHVPFVTTYHSKVHEAPRIKVFYNSVMARGDAVIANSAYTAARIARIHAPDPARIFTVPRGVDTAAFDEAAVVPERIAGLHRRWKAGGQGRVVFLLAARVTRWKGQAVAVEAAAKLKAAGVENFELLLAGDAQGRDAYVNELEARIAREGLGEIVRIVGHCDDMPAAYALSDVVLAPSIEAEPFGRASVEAQAMGRPVIVSDAGGQRETVNAETGLAVPPGDATALAAAMRRLIDLGAEGRRAMGARGRAHARAHYSLEAMSRATLAVYAQLIADARSHPRAGRRQGKKRG